MLHTACDFDGILWKLFEQQKSSGSGWGSVNMMMKLEFHKSQHMFLLLE
jgi:hypothetical protein